MGSIETCNHGTLIMFCAVHGEKILILNFLMASYALHEIVSMSIECTDHD